MQQHQTYQGPDLDERNLDISIIHIPILCSALSVDKLIVQPL